MIFGVLKIFIKPSNLAQASTYVAKHSMNFEPAVKVARFSMMKIGTHNGTFHCDESLACFLLRQLPEYKTAEIVRTRDAAVLETCDVVVDVGGVYDPKTHKYDHHQRSFAHTMNSLQPKYPWTTKLSSAGLVYLHFGARIVSQILQSQVSDNFTQIVFNKLYEGFIEEVDGIDNGVNPTEEKPRYSINTNLSSRVSHLNPLWNEEATEQQIMERFHKAMEITGSEFVSRVEYYRDAWWPARQLVLCAVQERFQVDSSGEIMKFAEGGCPWKDHLLTMEEEDEIKPSIKFALYPDQNGAWRVQCVPKERNTFENRLSLLPEWQGLRDDELSKYSGIPQCIFVHASGFIGGNKTYDGALAMARQTLQGKSTP